MGIDNSIKTLLLVEDEKIIAIVERAELERCGYQIIHVTSGEEAIKAVNQYSGRIDLILMDIDLGAGIDGTEAAEIILKDIDIPIVFLSSHTEPEVVEKTEKISSYGYVVKNSGIVILDASIKMAFKLNLSKQNEKKQLEHLQEIESYRKVVFDSSSIPQIIMDYETLAFVDLNQAAVKIYGFGSRSGSIGKTPVDVSAAIQYDGSPSLEKARYFIDIAKRDGSVVFEWRHMRSNGEFWDAEVHLLRFNTGVKPMLQFSLVDITKRKQAEDKYRLLAENTSDLVWTCKGGEENFRMVYINPTVQEMLGFSVEEYLDLPIQKRMTEESLRLAGQLVAFDVTTNKKSAKVVIDNYHKNGSLVKCEVLVNPVFDNSGKIVMLYGRTTNISEQDKAEKKLEKALKESNELFSLFIKNSPIYTYIKKVEPERSVVINASDNFKDMIGFSGLSMIGKSMEELFEKDFAKKMTIDDWRVIVDGAVLKIDEELNGRFYKTIKYPLMVGEQRLLAGYTIDVTDMKKAENCLKDRLQGKELIIKEVHHRIKNNISFIESMIKIYATKIDNEEAIVVLKDVLCRLESMRRIYDQLLYSSEYQNVSLKVYLLDLTDAIKRLFSGMEGVVIETDLEDISIDVKVLFPIGAIVNELITNAIKYGFPNNRSGKVAVVFKITENKAILSVEDNGVGFPKDFDVVKDGGFGMWLVKILTDQLTGQFQFINDVKPKFIITFPYKN